MSVYENCPILENENFIIRLMEMSDAEDLFKVYSDKLVLPFMNSDSCNGSNFYCEKKEYVQGAVKFWIEEYKNKGFVRFSIIAKNDKSENFVFSSTRSDNPADYDTGNSTDCVIGSIELFNRQSTDFYTNCGLLRLDVRRDYENVDSLTEILSLITEHTYDLFECDFIATKAQVFAVDRIEALKKLGFEKSEKPLIGVLDNKSYYDYWIKRK